MKVVLVDIDEDALSQAEAECQAELSKAGLAQQGAVMSVQADVSRCALACPGHLFMPTADRRCTQEVD